MLVPMSPPTSRVETGRVSQCRSRYPLRLVSRRSGSRSPLGYAGELGDRVNCVIKGKADRFLDHLSDSTLNRRWPADHPFRAPS